MREEDHIHYSDDDLFNPETHHETSDVNVRALLWFLAIFVILGIITHVALTFFYKGLSKVERERESEMLTQIQRPADADVPRDEPLLQPFPRKVDEKGEVVPPYRNTPVTDLHDMRAAEQQVLDSYGWVDQQRGVVHIPIDVAKRLVVERGLPVQLTTTATPPQTTTNETAGGQQ